jgi:hypothetical protein
MPAPRLADLLCAASRPVLAAFHAAHPGEAPTAVGYVFALHNVHPQLDLCAHLGPLPDDDDERWNSGDFDFPAGLTGARGELGPAVAAAVAQLHAAARGQPPRGPAYQQITEACCAALLQLRAEGLIPASADLNVAEVGDPSEAVAARGAHLAAGHLPPA